MRGQRLVGLTVLGAAVLTAASCGVAVRGVSNGVAPVRNSTLFHQGRHGPLTDQERTWAKVAWQYFENNYSASTGLVNGADNYPVTTLWYMADALAALIAAQELGVITPTAFKQRLSKFLQTLNSMPLLGAKLPNKMYHTATAAMVDADSQAAAVGWSAIDLGRLLIWLKILRAREPALSEDIDRAVRRWDVCRALDRCGVLNGGVQGRDDAKRYQETRAGYEQYAALGYQAWGGGTSRTAQIESAHTVRLYGIEVSYDGHTAPDPSPPTVVLSLPSILQGLEFNWDRLDDQSSRDTVHTDAPAADFAERLYRVQEARYQHEKIFTARTDHQRNQPPFYIYDTIFANGAAWNTLSDGLQPHPELALVSTRAAFGLWALWKTAYTDQLLDVVDALYDPKRGWYEGRYEHSGGTDETITCSTNAIVLETLFYKVHGKLYRLPTTGSDPGGAQQPIGNWPAHCPPSEPGACP